MIEADRLRAWQIAPNAITALRDVEDYVKKCGLEKSLVELLKMRASQINGCAYCLDTHGKEARRAGERESRLYLLNAWRESDVYSPRERAALAWTEAVTQIAQTHAPDELFQKLRPHFSEKEIVDLTVLVALINLWNRIAIRFRYRPAAEPAKPAWSAPKVRDPSGSNRPKL